MGAICFRKVKSFVNQVFMAIILHRETKNISRRVFSDDDDTFSGRGRLLVSDVCFNKGQLGVQDLFLYTVSFSNKAPITGDFDFGPLISKSPLFLDKKQQFRDKSYTINKHFALLSQISLSKLLFHQSKSNSTKNLTFYGK